MSRLRWSMFLILLSASAAGGWFFGRSIRPPETVSQTERSSSAHHVVKISPAFAAPDTPTGSWAARVRLGKPADFLALLAEWDSMLSQETERDQARAKRALEWMFGVWLTRDRDGFLQVVLVPDFPLADAAAAALVRVMPEKAAALVAEPAQNDIRYFISFLSAELAQRHPALYLKVVPVPEDLDGSPWAAAIAALAKSDPRAAADICVHAKIEDPSRLESPLFTALMAWRDGDAALADWIVGIADPDLRRVAEQARLSLLAKRDPRAALEKLASMDLGEPLYSRDGQDARLEIAAQLAKADPAAAIQLLKNMEGVFAKFASGNPDPFAEPSAATLGKAPGPFGAFNDGGSESPEQNPLRKAIVAALAKALPTDPARLFDVLRGWHTAPDDPWQHGFDAEVLRARLGQWQGGDCLAAAGLWLTEMGGNPGDPIVHELAKQAALDDPEAAWFAAGPLPEAARAMLAGEIVLALPAEQPERRIQLFGQLSAEQWNDGLGAELGKNGAQYAAAIAALPSEVTLGAQNQFFRQWADRDPDAASRWVEEMPADAAAYPSALGLARAWSAYDEYATSEWAASLPVGPARNGAAKALAETLADHHPREAWPWAASISDPGPRKEAMERVARSWGNDAPPDFQAALEDARARAKK